MVLLPQQATAVNVATTGVQVFDRNITNPDTLRVRVTTTVVVPQGELIPLGYAQIRVASGAATFNATGHMYPAMTCVATIASVSGPAPSFGAFNGYGYQVVPNLSGYGYDFDSPFSVDFSGYSSGYTAGYGYGYGSATADVILTVTLEADDCPGTAAFSGQTVAQFTYQPIVGASETLSFAGLPQTLFVRNPEAPFASPIPAGPGQVSNIAPAADSAFVPSFQAGTVSTFTFSGFAGSAADGLLFLPAGDYSLPLPAGTVGAALTLTLQQPLPEGASFQLSFQDLATQGGPFSLGSAPFNIAPATLAAISNGVPPAGFLSIQASGLPPGSSASDYFDLRVTLDVPKAYFAGPPVLSPATFRLARFNDDGTPNPANRPTCTGPTAAPVADNHRFSCRITAFSAFAMLAGFRTVGGGGGPASTESQAPPTSPVTAQPPILDPSPTTSTGPGSTPTGGSPGTSGGPGTDGSPPASGSSFPWTLLLVVVLAALAVGLYLRFGRRGA